MTKVTDEQIADVCCSHNALARSTEPGITGEGVQDYWYCTLCESRFIPQWHLLDYLSTTIKERDTTIAEQAAEIERLRGTLDTLARLGNGDQYGNSDGNTLALLALGKAIGDK